MWTVGELKVKSIHWIKCAMKNRDKGLLTWKDESMFTEWKKTDKGAVERKINIYIKKVQELSSEQLVQTILEKCWDWSGGQGYVRRG